jgi:septal ring factor EnvC (AmiA/AmiB activator)
METAGNLVTIENSTENSTENLNLNVNVPPHSPEFEENNKRTKYYKMLSKDYKEDNDDLLQHGYSLLKKNQRLSKMNKELKNENQRLQKDNKKINLVLLERMEKSAIYKNKYYNLRHVLKSYCDCECPNHV